jgi:hypothetical protein
VGLAESTLWPSALIYRCTRARSSRAQLGHNSTKRPKLSRARTVLGMRPYLWRGPLPATLFPNAEVREVALAPTVRTLHALARQYALPSSCCFPRALPRPSLNPRALIQPVWCLAHPVHKRILRTGTLQRQLQRVR